jgi:hypothetical protein
MKASRFFKVSPMYDSYEFIPARPAMQSDSPPVLGSCAECGETVLVGESFTKSPAGRVCQTCLSNHCVMCGNPEATRQHEGDEPLCEPCRYRHEHRADQMYCDAQFAFYERKTDDRD